MKKYFTPTMEWIVLQPAEQVNFESAPFEENNLDKIDFGELFDEQK